MNQAALLVLTSMSLIALNIVGWLLLKKDADYLRCKGMRSYVVTFLIISSLVAFFMIGGVGLYLYGWE